MRSQHEHRQQRKHAGMVVDQQHQVLEVVAPRAPVQQLHECRHQRQEHEHGAAEVVHQALAKIAAVVGGHVHARRLEPWQQQLSAPVQVGLQVGAIGLVGEIGRIDVHRAHRAVAEQFVQHEEHHAQDQVQAQWLHVARTAPGKKFARQKSGLPQQRPQGAPEARIGVRQRFDRFPQEVPDRVRGRVRPAGRSRCKSGRPEARRSWRRPQAGSRPPMADDYRRQHP